MLLQNSGNCHLILRPHFSNVLSLIVEFRRLDFELIQAVQLQCSQRDMRFEEQRNYSVQFKHVHIGVDTLSSEGWDRAPSCIVPGAPHWARKAHLACASKRASSIERRPALPDKQWAEHEITYRIHRQLCPEEVAADILMRLAPRVLSSLRCTGPPTNWSETDGAIE